MAFRLIAGMFCHLDENVFPELQGASVCWKPTGKEIERPNPRR
jgi:hypothetical protein